MQSPFLTNLLEIFQFINNLCRCFILCYHSFSFVVPLVAIRYHSLSFVVPSLSFVAPLVVFRYHTTRLSFCKQSFFSFALASFCLIILLFCLNFCFLNNFEIVRFIVKSLVVVQRISVEVQLKKKNLKSLFLDAEFGCPNRYTGLQNGLHTSLI